MECDVRDYIHYTEGGFLGRPESATSGMTDKEIALSLGFTWPSLKVNRFHHDPLTFRSLCLLTHHSSGV